MGKYRKPSKKQLERSEIAIHYVNRMKGLRKKISIHYDIFFSIYKLFNSSIAKGMQTLKHYKHYTEKQGDKSCHTCRLSSRNSQVLVQKQNTYCPWIRYPPVQGLLKKPEYTNALQIFLKFDPQCYAWASLSNMFYVSSIC